MLAAPVNVGPPKKKNVIAPELETVITEVKGVTHLELVPIADGNTTIVSGLD